MREKVYKNLNIVLIIIPFLLVSIALIFRNVDYIKISVSEMAFTTFFSWGLAYDNYKNMEKYMKERDNKYLFFASFFIPIYSAIYSVISNTEYCRSASSCHHYPPEWDSILTFVPWFFDWLT